MKAYKIISATDKMKPITDASFWAQKRPLDRVAAVEVLREQWMKLNHESPKEFQKVINIIELRKS